MSINTISGIAIKGISVCTPKTVESNEGLSIPNSDLTKLIKTTGIEERRISGAAICTSDLCISAANDVINSMAINRADIGVMVFVTQTPDYSIPSTAHILQNRLQLEKDCIVFEVNEGCSGYVYGLFMISSLLKSINKEIGLLLVGDTISKVCGTQDKSTRPLFGDAGTATILSKASEDDHFHFNIGGDGSSYHDIIINEGRSRKPFAKTSLEDKETGGNIRNEMNLSLDGMNVFLFGISLVPKVVKETLADLQMEVDEIDYFVFHQANMMMNEKIRKKLKIPAEKVPYSLKEYGNTSCSTIPITIASKLSKEVSSKKNKFIFCGFGVGVSWGVLQCELEPLAHINIIEYAD